MTACLAAERCDSPTLITKYALARNYSTNDPFITMHGTRRIDSHSQHTPCPPPIEAIPLIQQQPAIRIEYLPVRMTHSEEEKGDGQEATHTHSTTRAATASENPNTGGGGEEVEETQGHAKQHTTAPKGKEIAVALIAPGQFTLDLSVSHTAMHSFI